MMKKNQYFFILFILISMNNFSIAGVVNSATLNAAFASISKNNNAANNKYLSRDSELFSTLYKSKKNESGSTRNVKSFITDTNTNTKIVEQNLPENSKNFTKKIDPKITSLSLKQERDRNYTGKSEIVSQKKQIDENVVASDSPNKVLKYLLIVVLIIVLALIFLYSYKIKKIKKQMELVIQEKNSVMEWKQKQMKTNVKDSYTEVLELAKNNDPAFLIRFQEVYPEFCAAIKVILPDITINELHFCGFLKLKFSTKDIAEYQFVTPKAIQNRKNKLRKRLNLDPKKDLYEFLDNFK